MNGPYIPAAFLDVRVSLFNSRRRSRLCLFDDGKKLEGLEHGADDYIVKPFETREVRYVQALDMSDVKPSVATPVPAGMPGLLAVPRRGHTVIAATFMSGQVVMLDMSNPKKFKQTSVVSFSENAGPHSIHLTHDDKRLVVTDYFLHTASA